MNFYLCFLNRCLLLQTKEPENGKLYINDFPVTTFGQSNIDKEELLYVQTNMTASFDWFQVTVWNMAVALEKQMFNVFHFWQTIQMGANDLFA